MGSVAAPVLYALFVWWFSTGLVLMLVLRRPQAANVFAAAVLFPLSLYLLVRSSGQTTIGGVYLAFTATILLWGSQEIAFLTGLITGPKPHPCPMQATGLDRLRAALGAILYHEIALLVSGALVLTIEWHAANQVGILTFFVLWIMRLSAKLNLFMGVPVLNDEALPASISYVRSYFRRSAVNGFFPFSVVIAVLILSGLVTSAADPDASATTEAGYVLVAALMGLAILEHVFMLVPLPIDRLWAWSTGRERAKTIALTEDAVDMAGKVDRAVASSP
jgi:putative photosynthetic complex assembly protein 2